MVQGLGERAETYHSVPREAVIWGRGGNKDVLTKDGADHSQTLTGKLLTGVFLKEGN